MYKQKLTLLERITLPQIVPTQGSYVDNIVANDLSKKLTLTQAEFDKYGIKALSNKMISWNEAGAKEVFTIDFSEREYQMVKLALETADASKKLPAALNSLFEQICKPELPEDLKPKKPTKK